MQSAPGRTIPQRPILMDVGPTRDRHGMVMRAPNVGTPFASQLLAKPNGMNCRHSSALCRLGNGGDKAPGTRQYEGSGGMASLLVAKVG